MATCSDGLASRFAELVLVSNIFRSYNLLSSIRFIVIMVTKQPTLLFSTDMYISLFADWRAALAADTVPSITLYKTTPPAIRRFLHLALHCKPL